MRNYISNEQIWMARVHPPRSKAEVSFRSPLAILSLMGGGVSRIVWHVKWGPLLSYRLPCHTSPSATCTPLKCAMGPVLIGCSLALLGFIPISQSLALSGFSGCKEEWFYTSAETRNKKDTAFI
jgi:hypothetical protein